MSPSRREEGTYLEDDVDEPATVDVAGDLEDAEVLRQLALLVERVPRRKLVVLVDLDELVADPVVVAVETGSQSVSREKRSAVRKDAPSEEDGHGDRAGRHHEEALRGDRVRVDLALDAGADLALLLLVVALREQAE